LQARLPRQKFDDGGGRYRKISDYEMVCLTPPCRRGAIARDRFSFDSSRYLNHCSNLLTIIVIISRPKKVDEWGVRTGGLHDGAF
jgi:hypothetical protein